MALAMLTSALDVGDSLFGRFASAYRTSDAHRIAGWAGPRAGLDAGNRKIPCPYWISNPNSAVAQPIT
jgi:hypothetical protein